MHRGEEVFTWSTDFHKSSIKDLQNLMMSGFRSLKPLTCSEEELLDIASQYRTPFYLYDKEKITDEAKHFYDSFAWVRSLTGTQFKNTLQSRQHRMQ